jgi:polysaccharide biosynthesis protein PslH
MNNSIGRRKVLFLSFTYPSRAGSGSQLRSAALIRMLAAKDEVHLLIAGYVQNLGGPPDADIERLCRHVAYLRIPPGANECWPKLKTDAETVALNTIDSSADRIADDIVQYYRKNELDSLFVFRFDSLHFICHHLDAFPWRELDLDELPTRNQAELARVGRALWEKSAASAARLMERAFLPRFHRLFVASAFEAEEVRERTGVADVFVLPNIYPSRALPPQPPATSPQEILFVGNLAYPPNSDAVLYFCREIFPLIRKAKGDGVLFRVIGMGATNVLDPVKDQPGVEMMGYQKDLAPFHARAALVAVPLRAGTGTRLKILEAFALGRVAVSTSIGAQGLDVIDRKHILLADDPEAFARACIEVMDDPDLAARIRTEAYRLVRDRYSEEALLRCYTDIAAPQLSES